MKSLLTTILFSLALFFLWSFDAEAGVIRKPPINLGLVGYWSFDVGKGGLTAYDQSGNGNTGTLTNMDAGSDWVDGQLGQALDFDGSNDQLAIPHNPSLVFNTNNSITLSAWVYPRSVTGYHTIFGWRTGDTANKPANYAVRTSITNGTIDFYFRNSADTAWDVWTSTNALSINTWQHIVINFTYGNSGTIKFYVNEVLQSGSWTTGTGNDAPYQTTQQGFIGDIASDDTQQWNGLIDEVRIYNRALSAAEVGRLYRMRKPKMLAPNNNGLVGYWSFNDGAGGYATDFSGNGNTGTLTTMDAATDWVPGKLGTALDFDGSNDRVSLGNILNSITLPITFSTWVKLSSLPAVQGNIIDIDKNGNTSHSGAVLGIVSDGTVSMSFGDNTSCAAGGRRTKISAATASANSWHHIVGIIRGATDMSIYIDNVDAMGTYSGSGGSMVMTSNTASIGAAGNCPNPGFFFPGLIDEVRIYNRALSAAEVAGLYQTGYAKINAPQNDQLTEGLVGYWTFNGKDLSFVTNLATDVSGNGNHGRLTNMSTSTAPAIGKVGQALNFDGSDDYVTSGGVFSDLGTSNKSYSLSVWAKPDAGETVGTILHVSSASNGTGWCLSMIELNSNAIANSWKGSLSSATSTTVLTNDWYHIVHTWDSTNGLRIFINGALETTTTQTTFSASGANNFVFVGPNLGACSGNPGSYFNGLIDEVRIYNRALSVDEVRRLYNMGR